MTELKLYEDYSRQEAHDIFAPDKPFTPQAGTWGLHGIVELSDRPNDFVFFVTFGRKEGDHEFDEGILTEGVLRWQSQPHQRLEDGMIKRLIAHSETTNSIHLFLRTSPRRNNEPAAYTYLGRLKYVEHDREREQPVSFDWQLLDWPIPKDVMERIDLRLEGGPPTDLFATTEAAARETVSPVGMEKTPPPIQGPRRGTTTRSFRARIVADYSKQEKANRSLGLAGEKLVLEQEKRMLREHGKDQLAAAVRHVAAVEGDGAGYDVLSFTLDGSKLYIEVKTTRGPITSDFFVTPNEIAFARQHADNYELRRLYEFDSKAGTCRFYSIIGDIGAQAELTPTEYKVSNLCAPT